MRLPGESGRIRFVEQAGDLSRLIAVVVEQFHGGLERVDRGEASGATEVDLSRVRRLTHPAPWSSTPTTSHPPPSKRRPDRQNAAWQTIPATSAANHAVELP